MVTTTQSTSKAIKVHLIGSWFLMLAALAMFVLKALLTKDEFQVGPFDLLYLAMGVISIAWYRGAKFVGWWQHG